ncbi:MAG: biotin/lipoyl-containing protein [Brooklawnia sp.]|uniref:biotin/lipoyl-containing protein n=1 Tax=Brooklawnia sp. TaxID=2699740 RepID=UPI003C70E04A
MAELRNITMPKWGLSMTTGTVTGWRVAVGDRIAEGDAALEVATAKIEGEVESPVSGVVRRIIAEEDDELPVGALLAVVSDEEVSEAEIDAHIAEFQANFVPPEEE